LKSVHTPWKPSKTELRNREKMITKLKWMKRQKFDEYLKLKSSVHEIEIRTPWEPTEEEVKMWDKKVEELTATAENEANEVVRRHENVHEGEAAIEKKHRIQKNISTIEMPKSIKMGHDRTGKVALSYKESLPEFIYFASVGNLKGLQSLISTLEVPNGNKGEHIADLILMKDRNGSTAESWAAGGGYSDCLLFLLQVKKEYTSKLNSKNDSEIKSNTKKLRRRDGKTSLHYAARNGHVECMKILLDGSFVDIDEKSGDGTTPLHMACYGGKLESIKFLVNNGANAKTSNAWGCNVSHWIAMSINSEHDEVIKACNYLYHDCKVSFDTIQRQGHSCLHKAAQRKNIEIIRWMSNTLKMEEKIAIGQYDDGGNRPSDILESVGGDPETITWMRDAHCW